MKTNMIIDKAVAITKKPNKNQIFSLVQVLIADKNIPTDEQLAELYAFFLPPTPKKAKTPEQWIALAVADKTEVREYLRYIYSDGSMICATDGHRLHIWKTEKYPKGLYALSTHNLVHLESVSDRLENSYPDIEKVIPKPTENTLCTLSDLRIADDPNTDNKLRLIYAFENGVQVNTHYLTQATNHQNEFTTLNRPIIKKSQVSKINHATGPFLLTGPYPNTQAIIMPLGDIRTN